MNYEQQKDIVFLLPDCLIGILQIDNQSARNHLANIWLVTLSNEKIKKICILLDPIHKMEFDTIYSSFRSQRIIKIKKIINIGIGKGQEKENSILKMVKYV